jgi:hypothetical protein
LPNYLPPCYNPNESWSGTFLSHKDTCHSTTAVGFWELVTEWTHLEIGKLGPEVLDDMGKIMKWMYGKPEPLPSMSMGLTKTHSVFSYRKVK